MKRTTDVFNGKLLLSVPEVAKALSLAPRTVYNEVHLKTFPIPVKRRGKLLRFDVRDVLEYVDNLT